jgi:dGTPase
VTQVVSPGEGEVFHNRLTHTLKVAQVARRMAEMFLEQPGGRRKARRWGHISADVVEAAALAHDLGHPPFGHIAEEELNHLVSKDSGAEGYEGNAQSFRIVTKLCVLREEGERGLELTRATLNATLKYPKLWTAGTNKWGAYRTEIQEFAFARKLDGEESSRRCIEAQIMDWADDIAYSVHDTEDFYRAGLVPLDRLAVNPKERELFLAAAKRRREEIGRPFSNSDEELQRVMNGLFDSMRIKEPYTGTPAQRGHLRRFTSYTIGTFLRGTTLLDGPRADGEGLEVARVYRTQVALLKELTWCYVINNPSLAALQTGQRKIISTLYGIYRDAVEAGQWTFLPPRFQDDAITRANEYGGKLPAGERSRLVADIISSMTDHQATRVFQRMTGISQTSVLDPIVT